MANSIKRLIGDFIEINANIVQEEFQSKYPEFIKKFKSRRMRKRLLKNVERIRKSGIILDADNLIEYFSYIVSNYYPETKFGVISKCFIDESIGIYQAVITLEKQTAIILIDKSRYPKFSVSTKLLLKDETSTGINIEVDKLESSNYKKNKMLSLINTSLVNDICDFIVEKIKPYQEELKENEEDGDSEKVVQLRID